MGGGVELDEVLLPIGEAAVLTAIFAPLTVMRYRRV
jgi:hypothetical protein